MYGKQVHIKRLAPATIPRLSSIIELAFSLLKLARLATDIHTGHYSQRPADNRATTPPLLAHHTLMATRRKVPIACPCCCLPVDARHLLLFGGGVCVDGWVDTPCHRWLPFLRPWPIQSAGLPTGANAEPLPDADSVKLPPHVVALSLTLWAWRNLSQRQIVVMGQPPYNQGTRATIHRGTKAHGRWQALWQVLNQLPSTCTYIYDVYSFVSLYVCEQG